MSNMNKRAFTLAEVLITLAVLGIVAIITVPPIIQRHQKAVAFTKIKKAMAVYDTAIAKMLIENDIASEEKLIEWSNYVPNCGNTSAYFKSITGSGCQFQTSDKVYWDITDITNPVIALSKDAMDKYNETGEIDGDNSFKMVTSYDKKTGAFRVNDISYEKGLALQEQDEEKIKELELLFGKIESLSSDDANSSGSEEECDIICMVNKLPKDECKDGNFKSCFQKTDPELTVYCDQLYNENGDVVYELCKDFDIETYYGEPFGEDMIISFKPSDPTWRSVETSTYVMTEGYLDKEYTDDDRFIIEEYTKDPNLDPPYVGQKRTYYNEKDPEKRKVVAYEYHNMKVNTAPDDYYITLADNDEGFDPNMTVCTSKACETDFPEVYQECKKQGLCGFELLEE